MLHKALALMILPIISCNMPGKVSIKKHEKDDKLKDHANEHFSVTDHFQNSEMLFKSLNERTE